MTNSLAEARFLHWLETRTDIFYPAAISASLFGMKIEIPQVEFIPEIFLNDWEHQQGERVFAALGGLPGSIIPSDFALRMSEVL